MINKNGWRTCYYYIIGGFYNNAKAILTTRIAGGLFVSQSSVFRINEKLHNVKQGFALTIDAASLHALRVHGEKNGKGVK